MYYRSGELSGNNTEISFHELGHNMKDGVCTRCGMSIERKEYSYLIEIVDMKYVIQPDGIYEEGFKVIEESYEWVRNEFDCGRILAKDILE
jgi:hypothetical protein